MTIGEATNKLNNLSEVTSVKTKGNEIYITTDEDGDDMDACVFGETLDTMGLEWDANDCEGCYNEYVIRF